MTTLTTKDIFTVNLAIMTEALTDGNWTPDELMGAYRAFDKLEDYLAQKQKAEEKAFHELSDSFGRSDHV